MPHADPSPHPPITVRPATPADADAIAEIYNQGIRGRGATFETRERTAADVLQWLAEPRYPVLVADSEGTVVGWASSSRMTAKSLSVCRKACMTSTCDR